MAVKIVPETAKRWLGSVSYEQRFYCAEGWYLNNLEELAGALEAMPGDLYQRFAAAPGNDFSIWIREVIGDEKLAGDIAKAQTQTQAKRLVADRIALLKRRVPAA